MLTHPPTHAGGIVLAAFDQVPWELHDNSIILGCLSFFVALIMLYDLSDPIARLVTDMTQTDREMQTNVDHTTTTTTTTSTHPPPSPAAATNNQLNSHQSSHPSVSVVFYVFFCLFISLFACLLLQAAFLQI